MHLSALKVSKHHREELVCEFLSVVGHHEVGDSIWHDPLAQKLLRYRISCEVFQGDCSGLLRVAVCHHQDSGVAFLYW